jgi:hypothetical protein
VSRAHTHTYLALWMTTGLAARAYAQAPATQTSVSHTQAENARSSRSDPPDARSTSSRVHTSESATRAGYAQVQDPETWSGAADSDVAAHAQADNDANDPSVRGVDITPEELAQLLARYAREPTPANVVSAALRAQRRDPQRFADLANRARMRGLVPSLDVGGRRGQGVDLRSVAADALGVHETTADDLMLFATLRFDLGRLVFAREELAVAREERFAREAQNELVRQVVHLYFLRRRLMLERDLRGRIDLGREVRIAETEALLDTFTDGYFGRMIDGSHGQPTPAPTLPSSGRRGSRD